MSPRAFRDQPKRDIIEMMAHRREVNWRDSHRSHAQNELMERERKDAEINRGKK